MRLANRALVVVLKETGGVQAETSVDESLIGTTAAVAETAAMTPEMLDSGLRRLLPFLNMAVLESPLR